MYYGEDDVLIETNLRTMADGTRSTNSDMPSCFTLSNTKEDQFIMYCATSGGLSLIGYDNFRTTGSLAANPGASTTTDPFEDPEDVTRPVPSLTSPTASRTSTGTASTSGFVTSASTSNASEGNSSGGNSSGGDSSKTLSSGSIAGVTIGAVFGLVFLVALLLLLPRLWRAWCSRQNRPNQKSRHHPRGTLDGALLPRGLSMIGVGRKEDPDVSGEKALERTEEKPALPRQSTPSELDSPKRLSELPSGRRKTTTSELTGDSESAALAAAVSNGSDGAVMHQADRTQRDVGSHTSLSTGVSPLASPILHRSTTPPLISPTSTIPSPPPSHATAESSSLPTIRPTASEPQSATVCQTPETQSRSVEQTAQNAERGARGRGLATEESAGLLTPRAREGSVDGMSATGSWRGYLTAEQALAGGWRDQDAPADSEAEKQGEEVESRG